MSTLWLRQQQSIIVSYFDSDSVDSSWGNIRGWQVAGGGVYDDVGRDRVDEATTRSKKEKENTRK